MNRNQSPWAVGVLLGIGAITLLHYTSGHEDGVSPHHLYRRLFYLPILVAAWRFGLRGGLGAAALTVAVYVPHAYGLFGLHPDPSSTIDKGAEMVMYVGIGTLVGFFMDRERGVAVRLLGLLNERDGALAKLRETQDSLVEAEHQAAIGYLTAGLAHEIRNPLGSIRGSAEILEDELTEEDRRRIAGVLVRETERLDGVLTRFLRFAGQEPTLQEPTDLSALVDEVLELVDAEGRQRGVELHHQRCSELPVVPLDPGKLRQLLLNLVVNAMQVQPDGGRVRVLCGMDDGGGPRPLFVRVEDAGPGVADADAGSVFHPYYSGRPGGTGLGLAIARRVATAHGGTLDVAASSLGGAAFELRLPLPAKEASHGEG